MQLFLDRSDGRSLAVQLYDQVREAILSGQLPPGSRLQPTRSVAHELGVARSTVTDAYARLTAAGYVEGHRGGGSIVLSGHLPQPMPGRRGRHAHSSGRGPNDPTVRG